MVTILKVRKIVGYIGGVFDLFHVGHVNVLKNAKSMCDKLIVGVTTDELVKYKGKKSVIPYIERVKVVRSIKYVDTVIPQKEINKYEIWKKIGFDILFVGDDWYNTRNWKKYERCLHKHYVKVIYLPYTKGTTSTLINQTLENLRKIKN